MRVPVSHLRAHSCALLPARSVRSRPRPDPSPPSATPTGAASPRCLPAARYFALIYQLLARQGVVLCAGKSPALRRCPSAVRAQRRGGGSALSGKAPPAFPRSLRGRPRSQPRKREAEPGRAVGAVGAVDTVRAVGAVDAVRTVRAVEAVGAGPAAERSPAVGAGRSPGGAGGGAAAAAAASFPGSGSAVRSRGRPALPALPAECA